MELLDAIPFQVNMEQLMAQLHVRPGSEDARGLQRLVDEAAVVASPKVLYKVAYIEDKGDAHIVVDGRRFDSRILRVNLDKVHRVFAFVVTSGRELEGWALSQPDLLERFWAEAINRAGLQCGRRALDAELKERFGLTHIGTMNPGSLTDWPLAQQRVLFDLLGNTEQAIGVRLTDSLLMVPTKSTSGIIFPTEEAYANCQLCPREECPGRRAPYDATLYERKYQRVVA